MLPIWKTGAKACSSMLTVTRGTCASGSMTCVGSWAARIISSGRGVTAAAAAVSRGESTSMSCPARLGSVLVGAASSWAPSRRGLAWRQSLGLPRAGEADRAGAGQSEQLQQGPGPLVSLYFGVRLEWRWATYGQPLSLGRTRCSRGRRAKKAWKAESQ